MSKLIYKNFFITKGIGEDDHSSVLAFDKALMDAKIHQYNLVPVSSMLPYGAKKVQFSHKFFDIGEIVFCVLSKADGRMGQSLVVGLGYALGYDRVSKKRYGFILEGHGNNILGLKKSLGVGLHNMARLRKFTIEQNEIFTVSLRSIKCQFGCALVALIYRQ